MKNVWALPPIRVYPGHPGVACTQSGPSCVGLECKRSRPRPTKASPYDGRISDAQFQMYMNKKHQL